MGAISRVKHKLSNEVVIATYLVSWYCGFFWPNDCNIHDPQISTYFRRCRMEGADESTEVWRSSKTSVTVRFEPTLKCKTQF